MRDLSAIKKLKLEINAGDNIRDRSFNDDVEFTARQKIKQGISLVKSK
ncbi:hypothetical protein NQ543_04665 [Thomasclavelia spiroformis DSM 1552]|uniref:Uncharacterized protein n=1 Tax=Thomasclavelia spiroformis DSM 1552 TaxID=428126 RepID=B1C4B6_9FIRM|nr:hypothetical protein [Thomasclavelia spiroformis]EDS74500.1 hypothetical protein CLOSPI_02085 [Thomasclavelia spiroformis DSM 1552]UWO90543.1 hypothetical protein NQ543_04665 [Thomasclavelia spiroformis DSM 1552]